MMLNPLLILYLKTQVIDANRKVAIFAFYALKHREEMLAS